MKFSEQLLAYIATLLALVLVMLMAFIFGALNTAVISSLGAFGLGTVTGGLLTALRTPSATASSMARTSMVSATFPDPPNADAGEHVNG